MGFSDPFIYGLEPLFQRVGPQDKVMLQSVQSTWLGLSDSNREEEEAHRRLHIYDYDTSKAKARIRVSER